MGFYQGILTEVGSTRTRRYDAMNTYLVCVLLDGMILLIKTQGTVIYNISSERRRLSAFFE